MLNRNFHSNVKGLGRFYKHFLTSLYISTLFDIFLKPDSKFASWTNATLLRVYLRNLTVQRFYLQYKSQCLEKVNVKYVINSFAVGLDMRVSGLYQGRYVKCHIISEKLFCTFIPINIQVLRGKQLYDRIISLIGDVWAL